MHSSQGLWPIEANNGDEIKTLKEDLQKAFYDLSAKIYQQANPNGGAEGIDPSQFGYTWAAELLLTTITAAQTTTVLLMQTLPRFDLKQ